MPKRKATTEESKNAAGQPASKTSKKNVTTKKSNDAQVPPVSKFPNADKYNTDFKNVFNRVGGVGAVRLRGIEDDSDDEDDEDDYAVKKKKDYTVKQLSKIRDLIVTERRKELINKYERLANPGFGWFDTNTGNIIISMILK